MTWTEVLAPIKNSEYFTRLWETVKVEYQERTCYPPPKKIFRALELTPFDDVRVVILGQDPYHGAGQANGLSFSVNNEVPAPPSLRNIFQELQSDIGISHHHHELDGWAKQGVLLLNATLTVRAGEANSHQGLGWERFTDFIISQLSERKNGVVFVLWGSFAQKKTMLIDRTKHHIIATPHPSPLSAHRGFFGSKPFSKINAFLEAENQPPIDWSR